MIHVHGDEGGRGFLQLARSRWRCKNSNPAPPVPLDRARAASFYWALLPEVTLRSQRAIRWTSSLPLLLSRSYRRKSIFPVVPTEVDLQEDTTLGDDGISQDAYSSMDVTDGVLPRHKVDDPSKREGNGLG